MSTSTELLTHGLTATPGKRIRRPALEPLTGLRFFAAFHVLLFHYGAAFTSRAHMPRFVTVFLNHGNFGVSLFFILSGFILFYTYSGNLRTGADVYKFFVARFCRIYPVYLLAGAIMAIANQRLPQGHDWIYFSMLQSWVPASSGYAWIMQSWTLSVEIFFYTCFPLLLPLVSRLRSPQLRWGLIVLLAAFIGVMELSFQHAGMDPGYPLRTIFLPLLRTPEFVLGMLLGSACLHRMEQQRAPFNDWITFAGMLLPMAVVSATTNLRALCIACVFWFSWMIYRLASGRGWLSSFLSSHVMLLLGGASYGIYLMQSPVRETMRRYLASHAGFDSVVSPMVLIAFSCITFLYYEEPLREILRKLLTSPLRSRS